MTSYMSDSNPYNKPYKVRRNTPIITISLFLAVLEKAREKPFLATGFETSLDVPDAPQRTPLSLKGSDLEARVLPELCRGGVDPGYVKRQIKKNNRYFLLYYRVFELGRGSRMSERIVPAAFLLADMQDKKSMYIDVVCAMPSNPPMNKHNGTMLIEYAINYARTERLTDVVLSALPPVLTYYPRFGFEHRKSCADNVNVTAPAVLRQKALPKTVDGLYTDDDFLTYMAQLYLKGYGSDCEIDASTSIQNAKHIISQKRCGINGFKMRKCLS